MDLYLATNLVMAVFPVAYWAARRRVPWRTWAVLAALGFAFDAVQLNWVRVYYFASPDIIGMAWGEGVAVVFIPLRMLAVHDLCQRALTHRGYDPSP